MFCEADCLLYNTASITAAVLRFPFLRFTAFFLRA